VDILHHGRALADRLTLAARLSRRLKSFAAFDFRTYQAVAFSGGICCASGKAEMVQLLVRLMAASGHSEQLAQALQSLAQRATQSTGCSGAHVAADVGDAGVLWYCEEWFEARALEAKVCSGTFTELLALLETSVTPPFIEFRTIQESRGLDYVLAARRQQQSYASALLTDPTPKRRPL
jgi:quinol monooxygenase YgiN